MIRECFWLIVTTQEWDMRQPTKSFGEKIVNEIKRATRKQYLSVVGVFGAKGGLN